MGCGDPGTGEIGEDVPQGGEVKHVYSARHAKWLQLCTVSFSESIEPRLDLELFKPS